MAIHAFERMSSMQQVMCFSKLNYVTIILL